MINRYASLLVIAALLFVVAACEESPSFNSGSDNSGEKTSGTGEGGSMARMTIVKNYLYAVDGKRLKVFNLSSPDKPVFEKEVEIGRDIETIFGFKNYLYIGSTSAVYIYNIDNPTDPTQVTMIQHLLSCDPVIANDTIAFSTIRSTSECRWDTWSVNELLVLDVSNMNNVHQTHSYQLNFSPYGVGMKDTVFFLCKGDEGVILYDIRELAKPQYFSLANVNSINSITGIDAFDVIVHNNLLIVVGADGMHIYDITDVRNIQKLSAIKPD